MMSPLQQAPLPDFGIGAWQRGVSLIEFLVVIVIISIGLLSVAGMLAFGIKQDYETTFRTTAAAQARTLAERMHANLLGANAGFYGDAVLTPTPTNCTEAANTSRSCPASVKVERCTAAKDIAKVDRADWNEATRRALPQATCQVKFETNGLYTISIGWTDKAQAPGSSTAPPPRLLTFTYQAIPEVFNP